MPSDDSRIVVDAAEWEALTKENQRLRSALEAIAAGDTDWGPMTEHLARKALNG